MVQALWRLGSWQLVGPFPEPEITSPICYIQENGKPVEIFGYEKMAGLESDY